MAVNLQAYSRASARVDNRLIQVGTLERPSNISITGEAFERTDTISNAANAVMYSDELEGFNYLYIASDYNTRVQVTDNSGATYNTFLRGSNTANKYGLGFQLSTDKTSNTSVRVNAIQVFNTSGQSAKVSLVVIN